MPTKLARPGRPRKKPAKRKVESLDIRLEAAEKAAFRDAAELAGLDLSAWVRARLRATARKELEGADKPVAFMANAPRPDHVAEARYVHPSRMFIRFADGRAGTWTFRTLELDPSKLRLRTIRATPSMTAIEATTKYGDTVQIDPSWLRALVDPVYDAELKKEFLTILGPLDELHSIPQR